MCYELSNLQICLSINAWSFIIWTMHSYETCQRSKQCNIFNCYQSFETMGNREIWHCTSYYSLFLPNNSKQSTKNIALVNELRLSLSSARESKNFDFHFENLDNTKSFLSSRLPQTFIIVFDWNNSR